MGNLSSHNKNVATEPFNAKTFLDSYVKSCKQLPPEEMLKNALLSYALIVLRQDDIDVFNFNYNSFDGTKLPSFAGCDTNNAIMSYMNTSMIDKNQAIERYIKNRFATNKDVESFMIEFLTYHPLDRDSD